MHGSTLAVVALVVYWLPSGRSRELPWRRMLAVAGLIALGGALNGWFLIPDVSYGYDTQISAFASTTARDGLGPKSVFASEFFNTFGVIFDPLRELPSASTTPALYAQAPVLALIWGSSRRRSRGAIGVCVPAC